MNKTFHRPRVAVAVAVFWAAVAAIVLAPIAGRAETRQSWAEARNKMVDEEIVGAGVKDRRVIDAMRKTPRHEFISSPTQRAGAYLDMALPIGEGQTISPPFVVAYMTESLDPRADDKVLEIGTGSGYQAAVLSPLVHEVYTIEIVPSLGRKAEKTLQRLGYGNVHVKVGDGYQGWKEHAPFDKIIVTCSPEEVPPELVAELKEGGRMIIPVGERYQQMLYLLKKTKGKMVSEALLPTLFVPMTGVAEEKRKIQPDPLHPTLVNGNFEELTGKPPQPVGWHYVRQMTIESDHESPAGKHYATFRNNEPGRGCQALQGFAVDGRKVTQLDVSLVVRGRNIRPGQTPQQVPALGIVFYGENRVSLPEEGLIGPWVGSFDWQTEKKRIKVPTRARSAIVHIGLLGAVGELSLGKIELKAAHK